MTANAARAYIAIDLGAESGRTIVGVLGGDRLELHEAHRFLHLPGQLPNGLHWNLIGIWGNVLEGTRKAIQWADKRNLPIISIGVDTWGVDYALIGKSGELLGLPHAYRDARNRPAMDRMIAKIGREALYDATGIQLVWFNTLPQLFAQREFEPEMVERADQLLFMSDLMHYFFTGKRVIESSMASTSQMIDPRTGRWAVDLLDKLDIPTRMLRETIPPGTPIGPLLTHVAANIGASDGLQVIAPASHDTASAIAAVPADPSTNWCVLSSGTWSPMGTEIDRPCLTPEAREASFTNESGVAGTIRFLNDIPGLWLVQECRRHFEKQGQSYDYDRLTREAEQAEAFRTLVDPAHEPFHVPGDIPAKMAGFARDTGQPEPHSVGELVRCCLDSLALSYRHNLQRLESVLDRNFDVLHIVGGGSKNPLLNQMTADAIGRPVIAGPAEATAIGNLLVQAMGAGHVEDPDHIRRIVIASFEPVTLEPRSTEVWDREYSRYLKLVGG